MNKFFEFKENNKNLLFIISFLLLSIIFCTQFYLLEGSIVNFIYQPFLINFFGLSTAIFLFWALVLLVAIYYLPINFKNKKNIIFIFILPMILIIQMSSISAFFNYCAP